MCEKKDFLVELGTEELPPKALRELSESFRDGFLVGLKANQLGCDEIEHFATPRRLALLAYGIPIAQSEQRRERRGPALAAAYDAHGKPTPAALGFARSCGVEPTELETLKTDKGEWLMHRTVTPGKATLELLPEVVQQALDKLPIPKRMRWGNRKEQFVRPVHWVLALYGDQTLSSPIIGQSPRRTTVGHRFHHPEPIPLSAPADYAQRLACEGHVIVEFDRRKEIIRAQAIAAAEDAGGLAVIDEALLDEVTGLVEWPVAILGTFDPEFLDVPQEALISTMQDHQRYFPVVDEDGRLLPKFIATSNIESRDPDTVRAGNERVVRPRFADAKFFWEQDRKRSLASRIPDLESVVYHRQLGSLGDQTRRIAEVSMHLAARLGADVALSRRSSELAKCDLLTHMVSEFPELQGAMGRYYALNDGETADVATALEEQYLPRFSGDKLPASALGRTLSLATRLETIVGIFSIGKQPTGARDPYALRRNALGTIRLAVELQLPVDLATDLAFTAATFSNPESTETTVPEILEFFRERLKRYCLERGFGADEVEAASAAGFTRLLDFQNRIAAVSAFRDDPAAASLEAANKRIRNILRKTGEDVTSTTSVQESLLKEAEEIALSRAVKETRARIQSLPHDGQYRETLAILARLRDPVDAFFEEVLVMDENDAVRRNRLALLHELAGMFSNIADFSRLQR